MKETEAINQASSNINELTELEMVELFIKEDAKVISAIEEAKADIAKAIQTIYKALEQGGRLFYIGAGTSGRLGVLDASECPPTFGVSPELVQGIIAGGDIALRNAVEGAEDDEEAGAKIINEKLNEKDVLIGISASGYAPYVRAALRAARKLGCQTIAVANNKNAQIFKDAGHQIFLNTGAEIITGSTRLKAGTSQKLCLNIISTCTMVKLGKTKGNLMTHLQAKNSKLKNRAIKLVQEITGLDEESAKAVLEANNYNIEGALSN